MKLGLSQKALGQMIGEGNRHVSSYENGYYGIRAVFSVERILHALGYELRIHKRIEMDQNDWLKRTAKNFPKTVKVSPDLKNSDIKEVFGQRFVFVRASFKGSGYCVLGFKDEYTLATFCRKFAKHLVSEGDQT